ncbi:hypothetical protein ACOI1H_20805 [Loktanella sp. DJP18]|uniref:hypothetical protein n=1 Tax=Loktanella sp. DJP18 TaxID=3409788 RepID=UPI003BB69575
MTMQFDLDAKAPSQTRGAAPVGALQELPPVELAAIVYLRAWCEGGDDRGIIAKDFRLVMGHAEGAVAAADFHDLMTILLGSARRPIMRHGLGCRCFGGDESAFAHMIAAAASGSTEDAMLFASILMSGDAAWAATRLADRLGQTFLRLARGPGRRQAPTHATTPTPYTH